MTRCLRVLASAAMLFAIGSSATVSTSPVATAADHLDAPLVEEDGRLDINDLYAFQSPADADRAVLIMTVNPLAGVLSPTDFKSGASYEFTIDNDGDARSDVTFTLRFLDLPFGKGQLVLLFSKERFGRFPVPFVKLLAIGRTGHSIRVLGGGRLRADVFDDPFFFDLAGFQNGLMFTGDDFFEGLNVSGIVLEVPRRRLGANNVGVGARTITGGSLLFGGSQFDRMGRPAINTVLIPSGRKDEFNQSRPVNDPANFGDDVRATIEALSGNSALAAALTDILLPDLLTIDTSDPSGFLNGRQLADDVIDAELDLLTDGAVTGDGVDANDLPFMNMFPYLAAPH